MMDSNGNGVIKRGSWSSKEDTLLVNYIKQHGVKQCWRNLPFQAGLMRSGKSCRLRWMNYLRPDVKIGGMTLDEEDLIILLHKLLGNRWSLIAGRLPGRTDNEIKNYWKSHIRKRLTKNNNTLEAPCNRSKHGHRIEETPKSLDTDILHQVDQPIENGGTPFDLGTCQMATSSLECPKENVLIEKNTPTTSSTNYLNSTQDYEIGSCVIQVHETSIRESSASVIDEEASNKSRSPTNQKIRRINENLDASQTSSASTNIHAPCLARRHSFPCTPFLLL